MTLWRYRWHTDEDGLATSSFISLVIVVMAALGLMFYAGRVVLMSAAMFAAVEDGARAASLETRRTAAEAAARDTVRGSLQSSHVPCQSLSFSGSSYPGAFDDGTMLRPNSYLRVRASCQLRTRDISFLPLPGNVTISADGLERIDPFRGGRIP